METYSTKLKGDIAEYRIISELLSRGFNVLIPCGDRLRYDLAIEIMGRLIRLQAKMAWYNTKTKNYIVDVRRSQTNRRNMIHTKYCIEDFDFLIAWIQEHDTFYVFPSEFACQFGSNISMVETTQRQRAAKSLTYRNAWHLIH